MTIQFTSIILEKFDVANRKQFFPSKGIRTIVPDNIIIYVPIPPAYSDYDTDLKWEIKLFLYGDVKYSYGILNDKINIILQKFYQTAISNPLIQELPRPPSFYTGITFGDLAGNNKEIYQLKWYEKNIAEIEF